MEQTMERLSTGMRVNSASDDAAGLAIGSKMESQIRGLQQAVRNANDGISMIQIADGAAEEIGNMFQRMRELAVQAQNGTNGTNDLTNLNKEFASLATEIDRIASTTEFNNVKILDGTAGTKTFNVGADASDDLAVSFLDFNLTEGAATQSAQTFDLNITQTQLNGITAGSTFVITDSFGNGITITDAQIDTASSSARSTLQTATLADLATAATAAMVVNTAFGDAEDGTAGGFSVADNGAEGLRFTQSVAGTGVISSTRQTTSAGVSTDVAGAAVEANSDYSASAGVIGENLSAWKTAGSVAQTGTTLTKIDAAIQGISAARADFGAAINTLEYSIDNLNTAVQNTMAAKSAVMDADYASETTELARTQIISQASTAMLSQANQQAQSVLALLK
jgi:flagellin